MGDLFGPLAIFHIHNGKKRKNNVESMLTLMQYSDDEFINTIHHVKF